MATVWQNRFIYYTFEIASFKLKLMKMLWFDAWIGAAYTKVCVMWEANPHKYLILDVCSEVLE